MVEPTNARDVRDAGSVPESGRSLEGGHSNPLQYSCLENPMDIGAWWAKVRSVPKTFTNSSPPRAGVTCINNVLSKLGIQADVELHTISWLY